MTAYGKAIATQVVEGQVKVNKPKIIHASNMSMIGCGRIDKKVSYYGLHNRKAVKWWKKIFAWTWEVGQVNAHIFVI